MTGMDINDVRSLITVVSLVAFLAIVVWAYGSKRKAGFEEAARSVLDERDGDRQPLVAQPPEQLIYASCDLDSFLSQARTLVQRSPLRLRELQVFELFPQTRHAETLALFAR